MKANSSTNLEFLIEELTDTSDLTDEEVLAELKEERVNVEASKAVFLSRLDEMMADRAIRRRFAASRAPTPALLRRLLNEVRGMGLAVAELAARIAPLQPQRGYRELTSVEREDLETQYAELLAIQATQNGEVE